MYARKQLKWVKIRKTYEVTDNPYKLTCMHGRRHPERYIEFYVSLWRHQRAAGRGTIRSAIGWSGSSAWRVSTHKGLRTVQYTTGLNDAMNSTETDKVTEQKSGEATRADLQAF